MRTLRTVLGLILVLAGVPALIAGVVGWTVLQHRDPTGAYSAPLEPVSTSGYAVVVPDIGALVARHGLARRAGTARLRVTASSPSGPLFLGLAPTADAARFFERVARTELTEIRVADGPLPVRARQLAGDSAPVDATAAAFWLATGVAGTAGNTLEWDLPVAADTAFVLLRADGQAGIDATLSVALYPRWLNPTTWGLLAAGALLAVGGVVLLWPGRRREVVLVVEAHRVVELADQFASRVAGVPRNPARFGWLRATARNRRNLPLLPRRPADAAAEEPAPAESLSAVESAAAAASVPASAAPVESAAAAAVETAT